MSDQRLVFGVHAIRELIRARGAEVTRVAIQQRPSPRLEALARFARDNGVATVDELPRRAIERWAGGAVHQGAVAWAPPLRLAQPDDLWTRPDLLALVLDAVKDPQNFGAVLRSSVALTPAGAGCPVVWGENASAPLTPATFKASAGAVEHAELIRVPSLRGSLQEAQAAGVQVVGLAPESHTALADLDLTVPTALVLGAEYEGLSRGVRQCCTELVHLTPPGQIQSLNVSVAAGIALYAARTQRQNAERA